MKDLRWVAPLAITACVLCGTALAGGGPLGIDHRVTQDDSGIRQRKYQQGLMTLMIGGEIVGAVWECGETRLGKTF
ncbi:MAG: hypothetical protein WB402_05440 [Sulfuricaulis sp.]|uniref:hypothetical protein n=1 Tax=Sulfuricaulis sp. TaxID=2003553 RepID=UPI003C31F293